MPAIATVLLLVFTTGCSRKRAPTRAEEVATLTAAGWTLFAAADYAGAIAKFDQALAFLSEFSDAHLGRGWSLAYLGDFQEARFALVTAKELLVTDPDSWAGGAFVYSVLGDVDRTIEWAETALIIDRLWVFSHRTTIGHRQLRFVLAMAYWSAEGYVQCKEELDIIEPGVTHTSDPDDLLSDLQRLQAALRVF